MNFFIGNPRCGLDHGRSDAVNRHLLRGLAVVAITLLAGHVAPAVDDNNRYVKLTPLGDRVRLAYTVFFGEVPGAGERRAIDSNRDGRIDDAEARVFATRLGAQLAAGLTVEVDGQPTRVEWATIDPGMGTPAVAAGAFSVDLVAYLCLGSPRGRHHVIVRDRFRVQHPGETEAKVEDGPPGVTIERARVGPAEDPTYDYRFVGEGGPLETDGLEVVFFVADQAALPADAGCPGTPPPDPRRGAFAWWWVAILGAIALAAVAAWFARRRRAT
jgi:hypothetical protein